MNTLDMPGAGDLLFALTQDSLDREAERDARIEREHDELAADIELIGCAIGERSAYNRELAGAIMLYLADGTLRNDAQLAKIGKMLVESVDSYAWDMAGENE